ncbi:ATP-binding cassette domain-containing protein [Paenarthrobacter sp. NPDC058040]|uniref:ATP-binding cassette domain-containing protein n=1 Tax=unclassified Paenarthrobacter TaxID=2634190 RepID=UPI0036DA386A
MTSPLLDVQELSVTYTARNRRAAPTYALKKVSLQVAAGSTVALVGESGSGKSTLGNTVLGLVRPTRGRIVFDGKDITRANGRERRALSQEIQAVFQDPYSSFNPNRTVGQTVAETLLASKDHDKTAIERRVRLMLERVGLDASAASRYPAQFSGGQRQRIAIARALLPEPRLVVCDESVSALDLSVQAQILNLLADLQRDFGMAYLFITHDMSVVRHISQRVVVLRRGEMVEEGPTLDVMTSPEAGYTRNLLAAAPVPDPKLQELRREGRRAGKALHDFESVPRIGHGPDLDWLLTSLERKGAYDAAGSADHDSVQRLIAAEANLGSTADLASIVRYRVALIEAGGVVLSDKTKSLLERSIDEQEHATGTDTTELAQRTARIRSVQERVKAKDAHGAATAVAEYSSTLKPIGPGRDSAPPTPPGPGAGTRSGASHQDNPGREDRTQAKVEAS